LANAPFPSTAHMGRLKGDAKAGAAATGARTVPPREHGGNCEFKDLSRGAPDSFVALLRHFYRVACSGSGPKGGVDMPLAPDL
jgi:hypothetical protein